MKHANYCKQMQSLRNVKKREGEVIKRERANSCFFYNSFYKLFRYAWANSHYIYLFISFAWNGWSKRTEKQIERRISDLSDLHRNLQRPDNLALSALILQAMRRTVPGEFIRVTALSDLSPKNIVAEKERHRVLEKKLFSTGTTLLFLRLAAPTVNMEHFY